ncbi:MAG: HepT-like ribonuclease domain-containing protein [Ilumatobacteraceae bacterium]
MTRADDKRLDDIVEVAAIVARGRAAFDSDIALRRAVERCLEIIGEASKALSDEVRAAISEVPWREIIRLRDRVSHHYHRIEPDVLWVTAEEEVPQLVGAVLAWRQQDRQS